MIEAMIPVLIIEDEEPIRRFLQLQLQEKGFSLTLAANAEEGLHYFSRGEFRLLLLDLNLPDRNGFEVLLEIRKNSDIPIIILTVKSAETSKVRLLESGADDYVTKPFSLPELLARMQVALRHANSHRKSDTEVIRVNDLKIDPANRSVSVSGSDIHLTPTEFSLLTLLARNAGRVLTTQTIMREIWGPGMQNDTHYLRVYVSSLRKKIEPDPLKPVKIINEPAVGYKLAEE